MEYMKETDVIETYAFKRENQKAKEERTLPIFYQESLLSQYVNDKLDEIDKKLKRITELQMVKMLEDEMTVEDVDFEVDKNSTETT